MVAWTRSNFSPWRLQLMDNEQSPPGMNERRCRTQMRYLLHGCGDEGWGGGEEQSRRDGNPCGEAQGEGATGDIYRSEMIPLPEDASAVAGRLCDVANRGANAQPGGGDAGGIKGNKVGKTTVRGGSAGDLTTSREVPCCPNPSSRERCGEMVRSVGRRPGGWPRQGREGEKTAI
jgi:hypothetical protein